MAALTDAMNWYNLRGLKAARLKFHFKVEIYSAQYQAQLQDPAKLIFDAVRTIELPKYSIETEVANAWNVRQPIPTKINFEPISISFTDTLDNRFQKFINNYMQIISGSFAPQTKSMRKGFDDFGIKMLQSGKDCPIDRIVITRFYGADADRQNVQTPSVVTLWRPKIVDVQHDTLDYAASEAVTWQVSLRYESVTYSNSTSETGGSQQATSTNRDNSYAKKVEEQIKTTNTVPPRDLNAEFVKQAQDQVKLNKAVQDQISNPMPASSLNGMSFKDASALANANRTGAGNLPGGGV